MLVTLSATAAIRLEKSKPYEIIAQKLCIRLKQFADQSHLPEDIKKSKTNAKERMAFQPKDGFTKLFSLNLQWYYSTCLLYTFC